MNYKPSFTEISSNEIQSWVNYGNPGETTKSNPNSLKIRVRVFCLHYFYPTMSISCQPMMRIERKNKRKPS